MSRARRNAMLVAFVRTGERRYAVRAMPEGRPAVEMSPAPGFSALLPHDLQHFIVERALGIEAGIFGQLAAGGTAGTFHAVERPGDARAAARAERKARAAGRDRAAASRADLDRSERATLVCLHDWLAHEADPALRREATRLAEAAHSTLATMPAGERAALAPAVRVRIREEMQRLAAQWSNLAVGERLVVAW